jgi:GntR family transcriptional regulator
MRWTIDHGSRERLQDQIAGCVRRRVSTGELVVGEQLPPAAELATALSVDRNTVLAAYRDLRDDGVLEFRRGRGARVASIGPAVSSVTEAARKLIDTANEHGLGTNDLIRIIKELT